MGGEPVRVGVPQAGRQMKSLDLIAWCWPCEVAVVVSYALAAPAFMSVDWYSKFIQALPLLTALIAGQAACAYFGKAEK